MKERRIAAVSRCSAGICNFVVAELALAFALQDFEWPTGS